MKIAGPICTAVSILVALTSCGPEVELYDAIDVERHFSLEACDEWYSVDSSGHQGVLDRWDMGQVAPGAKIDFKFDTYTIPNRFEIHYPPGVIVESTGWRGSSWYEDDDDYPGGIAGPGAGEIVEVFERGIVESFEVRTFGQSQGTSWTYSVRCVM